LLLVTVPSRWGILPGVAFMIAQFVDGAKIDVRRW
jgi:hypothetical protein